MAHNHYLTLMLCLPLLMESAITGSTDELTICKPAEKGILRGCQDDVRHIFLLGCLHMQRLGSSPMQAISIELCQPITACERAHLHTLTKNLNNALSASLFSRLPCCH